MTGCNAKGEKPVGGEVSRGVIFERGWCMDINPIDQRWGCD